MDELEFLGLSENRINIYYYKGTIVYESQFNSSFNKYQEVDLNTKKVWLKCLEKQRDSLNQKIAALGISIVSHENNTDLLNELNRSNNELTNLESRRQNNESKVTD